MVQFFKKIFLILLYRIICPTVKILNNPGKKLAGIKKQYPGKNLLFSLWHESTFICFYFYRYKNACFLREASKKGDVLAAMSHHFGYKDFAITDKPRDRTTVKGTIQFIKYLQEGHDGIIALDGPNGPYHAAKPGVFSIAKKTNALILPVNVWYQRKFFLKKRWDKYQVPLPFSKCIIKIGNPFPLPEKIDENNIKTYINKLVKEIEILKK